MTFVQFISVFPWLLLIGSATCTGWYAITRGRIEYDLKGIPFKTGKLLKGWHFFWTSGQKSLEQIQGRSLVNVWLQLRDRYKTLKISGDKKKMYINISELKNHNGSQEYLIIGSITNTIVTINASEPGVIDPEKSDEVVLHFFKEQTDYIFPEWVRDWISECPTCAASLYGSLFYCGVVFSYPGMFDWSIYPIPTIIFFWGVFAFSLAYINTILAKKL